MNAKWCFSALIALLTLFGVSQKDHTVPNQEIVLQFSNDKVTDEDAQNAIDIVKKQLLSLGIQQVFIGEAQDGQLKITYYSDIDIANVKETLNADETTTLEYSAVHNESNSSNKDSNTYDLDVYEIQKGDELTSDTEGYLIEEHTENDRFSNPNIYVYVRSSIENQNNTTLNIRPLYEHLAIAIDHISYKIPEVRAGPIS